LETAFGVDGPVTPLFAAADALPEETLAAYPDGSAAIALRKSGDGWSLFVGAPGLTPEVLRLVARKAGAHLFTETDCNVYANGPILGLHAPNDGPVPLNTGRPGPIRDAISAELVGEGPKVTLSLKKGNNRVLRCDPPRRK
jgi:hypothetical protein